MLFGSTQFLSVSPSVSTTAYSAGDLVGGKLLISNPVISMQRPSGIIHSVVVSDAAGQASDLDVVFFSSDPASTTFTDNAAFNPADADIKKIIGFAQVTTHSSFSANSVSVATGLNILFDIADTGRNEIYAAIVSRGTPTYAASTDLTLSVGVLQD